MAMVTKMERGRFAPSPSGRMHLGNIFSALLAWLDIRSIGGTMVLRIEDLDPERCREKYAKQVAEDLEWLGLDWDEGYGAGGQFGPYQQRERFSIYEALLTEIEREERLYPCWCTRAQRLAAQAPHLGEDHADGACPCRRLSLTQRKERMAQQPRFAWRIAVPNREISFQDGNLGWYGENLMQHCGDFFVRRSDGVFAYQWAVCVDDALMNIAHVVRGRDLLSSTPRQIFLHQILHAMPPSYYHVPLLLAQDGRRLSKREGDLDMEALRSRYQPEEIIGLLAYYSGLQQEPAPCRAEDLLPSFAWGNVRKTDVRLQT